MTHVSDDAVRQKLLDANVQQSTLRKYQSAIRRFLSWVEEYDIDTADVKTPEQFDTVLCSYVAHIFREGGSGKSGKSLASTTLSAVVAASLHLRGKLLVSSRMVRGWFKIVPPKKRPPITWELT